MIKLDNKYSLNTDGFKGVELRFEEPRKRNKLDPKTKKETGETVDFIFKDSWYFPTPKMAIEEYFRLTDVEVEIEEVNKRFLKIQEQLEDINKQFKKANWKL